MKFYSPRRSTTRFVLLVACVPITLGTVIATPQITGATTFGDVWKEIVRVFSPGSPSRKAAGGKGGDNIIAPGVWGDRAAKPEMIGAVWNVRPVILYESSGNAYDDPDRIELTQAETTVQSFDMKDQPLHGQLLVKTELKPGQKYKIRQFIGKSTNPTNDGIEFVVMPDGPERQSITAKLAKLDCQFAKDEATRSTERIRVFVKAGLWSDALQEASALTKTDQEWAMLKAETIEQWKKVDKQ
jgi:hypothetical protein